MSSGVDSSTAAALLTAQYTPARVSGIFMSNWTTPQGTKCAEADWNDVQAVCAQLGISCERVSFEKEYWLEVFEPMIEMYRRGFTPNPDVGCNRHIKFGQLMKYLEQKHKRNHGEEKEGRWWLATGHYARVAEHIPSGSVHLLRPAHLPKDQSYYLSSISPSVLPRILFPLASYTKPEVRALARDRFNLSTAAKPDSQGLCFVSQSQNTFRSFLAEYLEPNPGDVIAADTGEVVAQHQGIWHATVGQKSGVSMPQGDPAKRGVWYVQAKDFAKNTITISRGVNNPALYSAGIECEAFEWLGDVDTAALAADPGAQGVCVQYQSLQAPEPVASLQLSADAVGVQGKRLTVRFQHPRRAIAPGQYLVMYNDAGRVLGSGIITTTLAHNVQQGEVFQDKLQQHA